MTRHDTHRVAAGAAACLALALALAVLAPQSAIAVRPARSGPRAGTGRVPVDPLPPEPRAQKRRDAGGNINYFGGPVMHRETTYAIFWDPGHRFKTKTKDLITRYLRDVAHDSGKTTNVYSVLSQYTDSGGGHAAYKQTFGGAFTDTHAYPANASDCLLLARSVNPWPSGTRCLEQSTAYSLPGKNQVVDELSRVISAHSLPTGMATVYFMITPNNVPVCEPGGSCSGRDYCAFHDHAGSGSKTKIWAMIPMTGTPDESYTAGCGHDDGNAKVQEPNGDVADVAVNDVAHELSESITDPLVGRSFEDHNAPAWTSGSDEVSDKCQTTGPLGPLWHDPNAFLPTLGGSASKGTLYTQLINGHRYYTQSNWSNKDGACKMREGSAKPPPDNHFSFKGSPKLDKRRGTARIKVAVPGPGKLSLKGKGVASVRTSVSKAASRRSTATLKVKPTGATKRKLSKKGRAKVKVTVTYTPSGGTARSKSESVRLVKHKRRH